MTTCAIILAAGAGTRMGGPVKQLLPLHGRPLAQHPIDAAVAAGLEDVVVVLGHAAGEIAPALALPPGGKIVVNPLHEAGQSTSLRAGLDAAPDSARAAVVLLGDQPEVTRAAIRAVVEAHARSGAPVSRAAYRGRPSHPVLLDRAVWPGLQGLRGDQGARALIAAHGTRVELVEVEGPAPEGVDTPEDYARLLARAEAGGR
jgi:CTP:molybdopterin cytidylyltransferase MocA